MTIPQEVAALLDYFAPVFSQPTYQRVVVLIVGTLLTTGRRTVNNVLRTLGSLAPGAPSSYHRVLSHAQWPAWQASCVLTRLLLGLFAEHGVVHLVGDDTVTEHRGKKVYGKSRHRDAVRSSHSYTAHRYGHKWVVLAVLVQLPWTRRCWALPILVDLYRSPTVNQAEGRPHRTPAELMMRLLRVLLRWFPERHFVFVGDSGFGTHPLARFLRAHTNQLTLISRFHADANLYAAPPPRPPGQRGRPRIKGAKLSCPQDVVAQTPQRRRLRVAWYGGGHRTVEVVSGVGHWYKTGQGLVPVRWVYVHDVEGTHRDDYLYSTEVTMSVRRLIEGYTRRWNIETTFQELRAYLGLESTCGRRRQTVLRAEPCLFGLYSLVVALYQVMPTATNQESGIVWPGKTTRTFSDVLCAVRRWLWTDCVLETTGQRQAFSKMPKDLQNLLLNALAPAM